MYFITTLLVGGVTLLSAVILTVPFAIEPLNSTGQDSKHFHLHDNHGTELTSCNVTGRTLPLASV